MRLARLGEGKSGAYRVILFFKSEKRTFFVYSFAKADRRNITKKELKDFRKRAKIYFAMTNEEIRDRLKKRAWIEII